MDTNGHECQDRDSCSFVSIRGSNLLPFNACSDTRIGIRTSIMQCGPCGMCPLLILSCLLVSVAGCFQSDGGSSATEPSTQVAITEVEKILPDAEGVFHIYEGDLVQAVLDAAATDPIHKHVVIHEGTYRPAYVSQAMIRFHARHDGLFLEGSGQVTLTAENREVAIPGDAGYPAVVNHVVYLALYLSHAKTQRKSNKAQRKYQMKFAPLPLLFLA